MQAKVDDDLYDWLNQWKWYAKLNTTTGKYYAARTLNGHNGATNKTLRMHNQILIPAPGCVIDHADTDTLNDQRDNLRQATKSNNGYNQLIRRNNTTGLKGISWHERDQHYRVQVRVGDGKRVVRGFKTIEEAINFRDEMYKKYHREFANKN